MRHEEFYTMNFGNKQPSELRDKDRKHYLTYMFTKNFENMESPNPNAHRALIGMLTDLCSMRASIELDIMRQRHILKNNGTTYNRSVWRTANNEFDLSATNVLITRIRNTLLNIDDKYHGFELADRGDDVIADIKDDVQLSFDRWVATTNIVPYAEHIETINATRGNN